MPRRSSAISPDVSSEVFIEAQKFDKIFSDTRNITDRVGLAVANDRPERVRESIGQFVCPFDCILHIRARTPSQVDVLGSNPLKTQCAGGVGSSVVSGNRTSDFRNTI